jgi:hypothetical protein
MRKSRFVIGRGIVGVDGIGSLSEQAQTGMLNFGLAPYSQRRP